MVKPKCTQYITRWLFKVCHLFIFDRQPFWTGITYMSVHCTIVFYLTISNNTQHSKGAYGSKLKDLILGGRCKTFYRKTIFRCTLCKRLVNRKTMSKFVNWWILKSSYFGQGCRINLLYASLFFWLTYLFKEVAECRGDIQAVKSTPL